MTMLDRNDIGIARPGDQAYDKATAVFNLSAPARPAVAMTVHSVSEIRAALAYAVSAGLPVRVHTTGHASAAVRPCTGALLIRTELDGDVEIDADRRIARIPAGTRWGAVVAAAATSDLAAPHGTSGTVGVVGYLLRGGLSCYGRSAGLAANSVLAIEVVTADGTLRRVDADTDPELFRAMRGGGGGFGIVTAIEVALFPATDVVTGAAFWPAVHADALLATWRRWAMTAPPQVTTSFRVMNLPPLPEVPEVLSAGPVVSVDGAVLGSTGDRAETRRVADDLLTPLRAIADPILDTWQAATTSMVLEAHMDPADPVPFIGDHMLLREIGDDGAAAFLRLVGPGSGSPFVLAGLRQLGGAYLTPNPAGGVLDHIDAAYSYACAGVPAGPFTEPMVRDHIARVREVLEPWDTGRTAPSFVEDFSQPQRHLDPDQVAAVDRARARVDPTGLFRGDIAPNATADPV